MILCLKGQNSHKCMRSWSLVCLIHWARWNYGKKFSDQSGLHHCLILLRVLSWGKLLNISRAPWLSCMVLELSVPRAMGSTGQVISSKGTWAVTVFNKQKRFPGRQEEKGKCFANTYTYKSKTPSSEVAFLALCVSTCLSHLYVVICQQAFSHSTFC